MKGEIQGKNVGRREQIKRLETDGGVHDFMAFFDLSVAKSSYVVSCPRLVPEKRELFRSQ